MSCERRRSHADILEICLCMYLERYKVFILAGGGGLFICETCFSSVFLSLWWTSHFSPFFPSVFSLFSVLRDCVEKIHYDLPSLYGHKNRSWSVCTPPHLLIAIGGHHPFKENMAPYPSSLSFLLFQEWNISLWSNLNVLFFSEKICSLLLSTSSLSWLIRTRSKRRRVSANS